MVWEIESLARMISKSFKQLDKGKVGMQSMRSTLSSLSCTVMTLAVLSNIGQFSASHGIFKMAASYSNLSLLIIFRDFARILNERNI